MDSSFTFTNAVNFTLFKVHYPLKWKRALILTNFIQRFCEWNSKTLFKGMKNPSFLTISKTKAKAWYSIELNLQKWHVKWVGSYCWLGWMLKFLARFQADILLKQSSVILKENSTIFFFVFCSWVRRLWSKKTSSWLRIRV